MSIGHTGLTVLFDELGSAVTPSPTATRVVSAVTTATGASSTSSSPPNWTPWATLAAAVVAALVAGAGVFFQRKTGKDTASAAAAEVSSAAAERAAAATTKAAQAAETGTSQLELRSKREETMRSLRWAAELAVDTDEGRSRLGLRQLDALGNAPDVEAAEKALIYAALQAVIRKPQQEIDRQGGVAVIGSGHLTLTGRVATALRSEVDQEEEEA